MLNLLKKLFGSSATTVETVKIEEKSVIANTVSAPAPVKITAKKATDKPKTVKKSTPKKSK